MNKTSINFLKPIYAGAVILELAKTVMYDFHYDFIRKHFSAADSALIYTDTDSLLYLFKHENIYEFIRDNIERFDTSGYPKDKKYGIQRRNEKVLGKMKDETNLVPIEKIVCLRSKLYAAKLKKSVIKRAKGIKRNIVNKTIVFEDYEKCLFDNKIITRDQKLTKNKKHTLYSVNEKKIALSPFDDKRYIIKNSVETLPWGHYKIPQLEVWKLICKRNKLINRYFK